MRTASGGNDSNKGEIKFKEKALLVIIVMIYYWVSWLIDHGSERVIHRIDEFKCRDPPAEPTNEWVGQRSKHTDGPASQFLALNQGLQFVKLSLRLSFCIIF